MKKMSSPNFNARDPKIALDYIVLHYTDMKDAASAIARLCDPAAQVSAHYVVDEDGGILQLVDEDKRAWHAGISFWRGITDINSASIGIELVNPGHEFGYRPFPEAQITTLVKLAREITVRHKMSATTAILAHSDVAPTRKRDPGELFPWPKLAQEGLGLWPVPEPQDFAVATEKDIAEMLGTIGYDTTIMSDTLLAFQRRYHPESLMGIADQETVARIRALKRLLTA
jgi:N-acetylmuramoyl-L-alanine amidase